MKIPYAQLGVCCATIVVLYDAVTYIYRISDLYVIEEVGHIERDSGNMVVWL